MFEKLVPAKWKEEIVGKRGNRANNLIDRIVADTLLIKRAKRSHDLSLTSRPAAHALRNRETKGRRFLDPPASRKQRSKYHELGVSGIGDIVLIKQTATGHNRRLNDEIKIHLHRRVSFP